MRQPFYILAHCLPQVSIETLVRTTHKYVVCPYYHVVSDTNLPYIKPLYSYRNIKKFCQDLDFLQANFQPIHWYDIDEAERTQTPSFCLTFDDGMKEMYTIIAPILKERHIPAICFLNSAFVNNKDFFYRYKAGILMDYGERYHIGANFINRIASISYNQRFQLDTIAQNLQINLQQILTSWSPYLTTAQIKELQQEGIEFGGHSVDHPHYNELTTQQQYQQTFDCMKTLTEMFNLSHQLFSFPFNQKGINHTTLQSISTSMDCVFGTDNLRKCEHALHNRVWMEGYSNFSAEDIIKGEYIRELLIQKVRHDQ